MDDRVPHTPASPLYGIFNDSYPPILDGVTLTVENYVRWLGHNGKTPCVVTPWNPSRVSCGCEVMRFFSVPIMNRKPYRYGYPKLDPFIWRRLRQTPFRLVHSHCPFSSGRLGVYAARKHGVPLIGTFHSKYRDDLRHSFSHAPWAVDIIMKRILDFFNACDHVWIPQAAVEETVREYGFKGPLTVVENGNDFATVIKDDVTDYKQRARRRLGIPDGVLSLLFVGQHIHEKGVLSIMDALVRLHGKVPYVMNFVGTGYAADEMRGIARDNGLDDCVTFRGVVSGREPLSEFYAAADLFLFPSPYDNAPLVVREAAAMGTPSLLLKGSTASEVVTEGVNGFLCGRGATDFSDKLASLATQPELLSEAGLNARRTLVRSWEDVVSEVSRRYDDILAHYRARSI